jgi:hypothetical protein
MDSCNPISRNGPIPGTIVLYGVVPYGVPCGVPYGVVPYIKMGAVDRGAYRSGANSYEYRGRLRKCLIRLNS